MPNPVLIHHLRPKNFLSFGPENAGIDLRPLNVIIGPNGSGKSNLIEAIAFMRSAPKDLQTVTRTGGGVGEWIWKGQAKEPATVDAVIANPGGSMPLRHVVSFTNANQTFYLDDERIENEHGYQGQRDPYFYYRYQNGHPVVNTVDKGQRGLARETIEPDRSILAQRRDPETYPELAWLAQNYEKIRIYREWTFARGAVLREPQKADMRSDVIEEDFSNLGLFLSRIAARFPATKKGILDGLKDLYVGITDFNVQIEGGTVQVFFTEGDFAIPATRLSDGTLRYLCLLAILCDPNPPPLICIEEPELGLHPDILPKLADLLRDASTVTQIIVTTHSDILIDAMTETPEAVIVCEKHEGQTQMERLKAEELTEWLEKYRLGELWIRGQIGGTRW